MLTDTQCRTAKPKEKLYRLNDFNGLYLEVKPKKAWRYRFKLNGKSSMFALGEYPTVKLAEAREKCEQARKQVADGVSPTQARQLDKIRKVNDASNTFELIAKEWLQMKDWAQDTTKTRRLDMLERVVFPAIGKLPVREIMHTTFLKFFRKRLSAALRLLPLKPVVPFHQFSSWQSRHLELIVILSGRCVRRFRQTKHSTNRH